MNNLTFSDILCLMLIYLKITGQGNYSWYVATSPFWVGMILSVIIKMILRRLK